MGINLPYIDPRVIAYFKQYDWPGNVWELQNVVKRILNLANGKSICLEHLPEEMVTPHHVGLPLENSSFSAMGANTLEKQNIRELLYQCEHKEMMNMLLTAKGNLSQVARDMGISRNTLYKKLRRLNISIR